MTRGHSARKKNVHVAQAIVLMYVQRWNECEVAMYVRLQSFGRRFLTSKKLHDIKELISRRKLDEGHAINICQSEVRRFLASIKVQKMRFIKVKQHQLYLLAVSTIEGWYVRAMRRYNDKINGTDIFGQIKRMKRCILLMQTIYRGYRARENTAKLRIKNAVDWFAAAFIQKMYRGSRVLHWRDLRMNFISAFILDRHNIERGKTKELARMRYKTYLEYNRNDSASGSEEHSAEPSLWVKSLNVKRNTYIWTHVIDGEVVYEEPYVPYAHEKALIGMRCRWVNVIIDVSDMRV